MVAKKTTVKKEVVKKPLKPIKIKEKPEPKKQNVKINFPIITKTTVKNFEINWFSLSRTFKNKFRFIYQSNKDKLIKQNENITFNLNIKDKIKSLNNKIKKYYECFNLIWDYYINKKQGFDLNKRIEEIMCYEC